MGLGEARGSLNILPDRYLLLENLPGKKTFILLEGAGPAPILFKGW